MKTQLLFLIAFLSIFKMNAQFEDWYLFTKASEITKIVPDDVNTNDLHLATDIGYMKFNTSTNMVTDFLNLTSQNPAIGQVKYIALDPTSNNIALTLIDGIAIYDGSTVTIYNYENSDLTIGESSSQFLYLQVEYAQDGSLYIFKEDALGYQTFNNGIFDTQITTTFTPTDVVENNAGTKVYFAGTSNGLWELEKSTTTWTNYTASNSDLASNFVLSLYVDNSDLLYIGGFQGLNTMSDVAVWNTYQGLNPINSFPYRVYEISRNNTSGDVLARTSDRNSYFLGLSIVDLTTNTWTNYTNGGTNCLDENIFSASVFSGDGNVYAAKYTSQNRGSLTRFNPTSMTCSDVDINYMNAPSAINSNVVSDVNIRKKASGNLDIGITKSGKLELLEIDPDNFSGNFNTTTTITPDAGQNIAYSLISDNSFFIVENNAGWVFIDDNNNKTSFAHNIPDYRAIITKKAAHYDSDNGIINIIHKGFDVGFNYRIYKTQCNTTTGTCTASEEMFTGNRDISKNISFGATKNFDTDEVSVIAIKTDDDVSGKSIKKSLKNQLVPVLTRGRESFNGNTNSSPAPVWNEAQLFLPNFDLIATIAALQVVMIVIKDINTILLRTEQPTTKNPVITEVSTGTDLDILSEYIFSAGGPNGLNIVYLLQNIGIDGTTIQSKTLQIESIDENGNPTLNFVNLLGTELTNKLPNDLRVRKVEIIQYNSTEALMIILTNYGLLIKNAIDISNLILSSKDSELKDNTIKLYPNPANNSVSFSDKSIKMIEIFDVNGRKVLSNNTYTISIKSLSNGLYIIKGKTADGFSISKKLIKN